MDLPPELQRPPVPVASEMSVEDGMEGNAGAEIKKPKKGHFLDDWPIVALIGITIIIILTGLFINLILDTVGTVKKRHPAPGEQIKKAAAEQYKHIVKALDNVASKGTIHKKKAARLKSRMARKINKLKG